MSNCEWWLERDLLTEINPFSFWHWITYQMNLRITMMNDARCTESVSLSIVDSERLCAIWFFLFFCSKHSNARNIHISSESSANTASISIRTDANGWEQRPFAECYVDKDSQTNDINYAYFRSAFFAWYYSLVMPNGWGKATKSDFSAYYEFFWCRHKPSNVKQLHRVT